MRQISRNAHAKINLALDVTGRREDGYHLVRMIMQEIGLFDTLTIKAAEDREARLTLHVGDADLSAGEDNLICRAARVMMKAVGISDSLDIELVKRIPIAAGLAGGSTDAAAVFLALRDLYAPDMTDQRLQQLALPLGADIPYCITGGTKLSEGIGEILTDLPALPAWPMILVKPAVGVNTGQVYRALDALESYAHPDVDGMIRAIGEKDLKKTAALCSNVLELVTGPMVPRIGAVEDFFLKEGALTARMSGSGPSVFALYENKERAADALEAFFGSPVSEGCFGILTEFHSREDKKD
ncbi:MAG: 4-(cytidine 5'-diphospho)-2-C-methyl-D-erythritol kinase [bacterium]